MFEQQLAWNTNVSPWNQVSLDLANLPTQPILVPEPQMVWANLKALPYPVFKILLGVVVPYLELNLLACYIHSIFGFMKLCYAACFWGESGAGIEWPAGVEVLAISLTHSNLIASKEANSLCSLPCFCFPARNKQVLKQAFPKIEFWSHSTWYPFPNLSISQKQFLCFIYLGLKLLWFQLLYIWLQQKATNPINNFVTCKICSKQCNPNHGGHVIDWNDCVGACKEETLCKMNSLSILFGKKPTGSWWGFHHLQGYRARNFFVNECAARIEALKT